MKHGTRGGYTRGCRCDLCRSANTDYMRIYHRARGRPPRPWVVKRALRDVMWAVLRQRIEQMPYTPAEYGRMGGLIGGRARARSLTPLERRLIARQAANARWHPDELR